MVNFVFSADETKVQAAFRNIGVGAKNLSHEVNSGIKESLAEAFSVALITEMVKGMVEFADTVVKGAEKIDTTTDAFQGLRIAARQAHADMTLFEKSFASIEKAASAALGGDSKTHNAFKNLGISDADLKNLDKVSLLQKILQGTQGQSRNEGVANLNALGVRSQNANALLSIQPQLADFQGFLSDLKENHQIASNEDLNNLAELKDKWADLLDELQTQAIPAVTSFLGMLKQFVTGVVQLTQLIGTAIGAIIGNIDKLSAKSVIKGAYEAVKGNIAAQVVVATDSANALMGNGTAGDIANNFANATTEANAKGFITAFGADGAKSIAKIINDQLVAFAEQDKKNEAASEARRKQREDSEKSKGGPANRVATIKGDGRSILDNDLKGADTSLVKIGALGGINDAYRLVRLSQEANNYLKTIAQNTDPANNRDTGGDLDSPFADG